MNKFVAAMMAFGVMAGSMAAAAEPARLAEGTEVRLVFKDSLSSGTAVQGQRFNLETTDDVVVDGAIVVPHGAKAVGTVVSAKKRGRMRFAEQARPKGDDVELATIEGAGHFDVVLPTGAASDAVQRAILALLAPSGDAR